jgi:uncharacterized Zn finger protein
MYHGVYSSGVLSSQNPPCPNCGGFMYFIREKGNVRFRKCRDCGFDSLRFGKLNWKTIKFYISKIVKHFKE